MKCLFCPLIHLQVSGSVHLFCWVITHNTISTKHIKSVNKSQEETKSLFCICLSYCTFSSIMYGSLLPPRKKRKLKTKRYLFICCSCSISIKFEFMALSVFPFLAWKCSLMWFIMFFDGRKQLPKSTLNVAFFMMMTT